MQEDDRLVTAELVPFDPIEQTGKCLARVNRVKQDAFRARQPLDGGAALRRQGGVSLARRAIETGKAFHNLPTSIANR